MTDSELSEPKPSESEELSEAVESKSNVIRLATGGGDAGGPWLMDWDVGTCFLARHDKATMLHEFWIVAKGSRAVKLLAVQSDKETYMWVDPFAFSKDFKLYEVIDP